jgi:hypothetical protein
VKKKIGAMTARTVTLTLGLLLLGVGAGCANVQVLRLTSETFPAREVEDVAILSQFPSAQYEKIAELSETSSSDNVAKLQRHLLDKAAELGADAVVFSTPITHVDRRVAYQPVYSPWGYYAPYYYGPGPYGYWGPWGYRYGPWGPTWGYQQAVPVPYVVRTTTVKGTAIHYS